MNAPPITFISFLGTNPYEECFYDGFGPVKFVQTALVAQKMPCGENGGTSRVLIGLTQLAKEKNWEALKAEFSRHALPEPTPFHIPDGKSEAELWEVFEILVNEIREKDQLVVDITHSFRSLPVILTVLLQYLRLIKQVELRACYYGAFEVLGVKNFVEKMDLKDRKAPVFDLTGLFALYDWSLAIHSLEQFGVVSLLDRLLAQERKTLFQSGAAETLRPMNNLRTGLREFSTGVGTCRQKSILGLDYQRFFREPLAELQRSDLLPAFRPVLEKLESVFAPYQQDDLANGILAARWCVNRGMTQQALTILQEFLISWIVETQLAQRPALQGLSPLDLRDFAASALSVLAAGKPPEVWEGLLAAYPEEVRVLDQALPGDFLRQFEALSKQRNDMNHCGFGPTPSDAAKLARDAEKFVAFFSACLEPFQEAAP